MTDNDKKSKCDVDSDVAAKESTLSQELIPVPDERRDGRSSGLRVFTISRLPECNSVASASRSSFTVAGTALDSTSKHSLERTSNPYTRFPFSPNGQPSPAIIKEISRWMQVVSEIDARFGPDARLLGLFDLHHFSHQISDPTGC